MYNAYLPQDPPYERCPEDVPPGGGSFSFSGGFSALRSMLGSILPDRPDSGDLILLLLLYLLWKDREGGDPLLLMILAAALFLDL